MAPDASDAPIPLLRIDEHDEVAITPSGQWMFVRDGSASPVRLDGDMRLLRILEAPPSKQHVIRVGLWRIAKRDPALADELCDVIFAAAATIGSPSWLELAASWMERMKRTPRRREIARGVSASYRHDQRLHPRFRRLACEWTVEHAIARTTRLVGELLRSIGAPTGRDEIAEVVRYALVEKELWDLAYTAILTEREMANLLLFHVQTQLLFPRGLRELPAAFEAEQLVDEIVAALLGLPRAATRPPAGPR